MSFCIRSASQLECGKMKILMKVFTKISADLAMLPDLSGVLPDAILQEAENVSCLQQRLVALDEEDFDMLRSI
jgi:hypothetical protein